MGALFSLLSLAAEGSFDILGGVLYILCLLLEMGIYTSHIIWRLRNRKLLRQAKESGRTVDELLEELERETNGTRTPSEIEKGALPAVAEMDKGVLVTATGDLESHGTTTTDDSV
ncbi:PQ loop repeat protein [Rasamsonia emersonii CBS 393.64]|uniref:PQ loop repeat protein n=1 Tax=Rasamsonia emersonii (strain ATCC 16479 / CBS 393.64 / IMI 116815) TaxID=1408163 RepID=A0A0F4YUL8_RASE3|nr:PQ loop repeat protein [Rasamsonia emersonii CBS 393.64]KKA21790.1 PQ loop repeat protein [Rasamsonia emersonii CBS 393.64]